MKHPRGIGVYLISIGISVGCPDRRQSNTVFHVYTRRAAVHGGYSNVKIGIARFARRRYKWHGPFLKSLSSLNFELVRF